MEEIDLRRIAADEAQKVREEAFAAREERAYKNERRPSRADEIGEEWDEIDRPMQEGWNVTSTPPEIGTGGRRRKYMR